MRPKKRPKTKYQLREAWMASKRRRQPFLTNLWHRMRSRTWGKSTKSPELYLGLPILSKEDFFKWTNNDPEKIFDKLYDAWVAYDYNKSLTPSVDRIDNTKGYVEGNIRWITFADNVRLMHLAKNQSRSSSATSTLVSEHSA